MGKGGRGQNRTPRGTRVDVPESRRALVRQRRERQRPRGRPRGSCPIDRRSVWLQFPPVCLFVGWSYCFRRDLLHDKRVTCVSSPDLETLLISLLPQVSDFIGGEEGRLRCCLRC